MRESLLLRTACHVLCDSALSRHSGLWTWPSYVCTYCSLTLKSPLSASIYQPGKLLQSSPFFLKLSWPLWPSRQMWEFGSHSLTTAEWNLSHQISLWMSNMFTCLDSSLDLGQLASGGHGLHTLHLYRAHAIGNITEFLLNKWMLINEGHMFSHLPKSDSYQ